MPYLILPIIIIFILYLAFSKRKSKNNAASRLQFYAKNDSATIFGHTVTNSLLYTCSANSALPFVINTNSAPTFGTIPQERISYWSSYDQLTPIQQGYYIEWLSEGKPEINELGYACLYYYGLEYRALIEKRDLKDILFELIDLTCKFNKLSSAYAFILYLILSIKDFSAEEKDILLKFLQDNKEKYSNNPVYSIILQNLSPAEQHATTFSLPQILDPALYTQLNERQKELLAYYFEKIQEQLEETELKAATKQSYRYDMAMKLSSLKYFTNYFVEYDVFVPSPKVQTMLKQACKAIAEMKQAINKFDNSDGPLSEIEKLTYLPEPLRNELKQKTDSIYFEDKTISDIESIAAKLGFKLDEKVSLSQSSLIVAACEALGCEVEPSAAITKKSYKKDSTVILYNSKYPSTKISQNYTLAALFTDLGLKIALEDSEISAKELAYLNDYIQKEFSLTASEEYRLQQHEALLLHTKQINSTDTTKKLIKSSDAASRKNIAQFIISLAKADGIIKYDERQSLQKFFKQLGFSEGELNATLSELIQNPDENIIIIENKSKKEAKTPARPKYSEPIALKIDPERLEEIKINTSEIHTVLEEIFSAEQEEEFAAAPAKAMENTPKENTIKNDTQLQGIIARILEKESWTRDELLKIMQNAGTMLASTIDEINAWSEEEYGDFLIEEEDRTYFVNEDVAELIKNKE